MQTASVEPDQLGMKFLMYQALGETAYIYIDRGFLFTMGFNFALYDELPSNFFNNEFFGFFIRAINYMEVFCCVKKA